MKTLWHRLSHLGVEEGMHFESARRVILLNRIAISIFIIVMLMRIAILAFGFQEFTKISSVTFIPVLVILTILYSNKKGFYKINAFILCVAVPFSFLFFSAVSQSTTGLVNINYYYFPRTFLLASVVLPLVLIDPKDKWYMFVSLGVVVASLLLFDKVVNLIGVPFNPQNISYNYQDAIGMFMLLPLLLIILAFFFMAQLNLKYEKEFIHLTNDLKNKNRELENSNEEIILQNELILIKNKELEDAKSRIELINKDLTDSIVYAKRIQQAVLFNRPIPPSFFSDNFCFYKPKSNVSGDFYYFESLEINSMHGIVVATVDCTGHGVPGGFLSMLGMTLLNEILQNENVCDAAQILNFLRARVKTTLNQTGKDQEQKDGMDMSLCIYYPEIMQIDFSGARNPLCIIDSNSKSTVIKGDRQPIGIHVGEKPFTNHRIRVSSGDMLYLFSDGLQDQFGGQFGKKLKFNNLLKKLEEISPKSCSEQKVCIETFIQDWSHTGTNKFEQIDDMVMLGLRV